MFTITIQKPTAEEAIAELLHAAQFYSARPELSGRATAPLPGSVAADMQRLGVDVAPDAASSNSQTAPEQPAPKTRRSRSTGSPASSTTSADSSSTGSSPDTSKTTETTSSTGPDTSATEPQQCEAGNGDAPGPRTAAEAGADAPSSTADEQSPSTAGSAAAEPQASTAAPDELRAQLRAVLTPLMADNERKAKVGELIASFGVKRLSDIPENQLAVALKKAKEL